MPFRFLQNQVRQCVVHQLHGGAVLHHPQRDSCCDVPRVSCQFSLDHTELTHLSMCMRHGLHGPERRHVHSLCHCNIQKPTRKCNVYAMPYRFHLACHQHSNCCLHVQPRFHGPKRRTLYGVPCRYIQNRDRFCDLHQLLGESVLCQPRRNGCFDVSRVSGEFELAHPECIHPELQL